MRKLVWIIALASICGVAVSVTGAATGGAVHPPFVKAWESRAGGQFENFVNAQNTVYYGTFDNYGAASLVTGEQIWEKPVPKGAFGAEVAFDGKTLYVSIGQGKLLACQPKTGKTLWSLPRKGYSGPMTVTGGVLYCEVKDGTLTAVDTRTHKALWNLNLETRPRAKHSTRDLGLSAAPIIASGKLFVGTNLGEVICLNPRTGRPLWRRGAEAGEEESSVPGLAVDAKRVYCAMRGGVLRALDIGTGKPVWRYPGRGYSFYGRLVLVGGLVVSGTDEGVLYAVGASDGRKRWEVALSRETDPIVSPPVVISGRILASVGTRVSAYNTSGKRVWEWDTEEDLFCQPITPLSDGLLLSGGSELYCFRMGQPPPLPSQPAARKAMAEKLVARFDDLTDDEKRKLVKLGDDAFEPLLRLVEKRTRAYDSFPGRDDRRNSEASYKVYEKFSDAFEVLAKVARKNRTPEMLALFESAQSPDTKSKVLDWLAESGDQAQMVPLFIDILKNAKAEQDGNDFSGAALSAIAGSTDPRAVSYLIEQLGSPSAPSGIRRCALWNVARTGGEAGARAVIAAKDTGREIGSLADFMSLHAMPAAVKPKTDDYEWPWASCATLLDTRKDSAGALWGLVGSRAVGGLDDLWVVRQDGNAWVEPAFTGITLKQLGKADWLKKLEETPGIAADSDSDGWPDLVEKRLGTDPKNADTDGDGLKDSRDKNPLAAPRGLSETERVLRAAFQARFQFHGERPSVCRVYLPKGIKPFEFYGWDWVTIPSADGQKSPLDAFVGKGVAGVGFGLPTHDFAGDAIRDRKDGAFILWNSDHSEAKLEIDTFFGGLDATSYDIHLKRFGGDWVVIDCRMTRIS